ncbi:MAG: DUF433 domain-containing protein [Nitrososphaerales archaeon]
MSWSDRIAIDEGTMTGKPVIKGTRITVELIVDLLSEGWTVESVLQNYPQLERQDVNAALKYAAEVLKLERIFPVP